MLEGLVAWVLNNYLGKYVENLNTDQLSVALLSGKVELENLPLKKDALRHLGLPVEVKAGFIGKVQLQVPVRQIRSAPWLIAIEKLYLVAAPVNLDEWDSSVEAAYAHERKVALLDALEAQWRAEHEASDVGYYATSYSSWLNYGTGLLANIVENLQLTLNDVHIRYEDALTCAPSAFACGLTAESLTAESCDSTWKRGFTLLSADNDGCSFKLLELQKLAVYWDPMQAPAGMLANCTIAELSERMSETWKASHRYILSPASATARVRRERTEQPLRSRSRPRIHCYLTLDSVLLNLSSRQYNEGVGCGVGLERAGRLRDFRALRPAVPVRNHAARWWLYALKCHFPDHHWMETKPTWESCIEASKKTRQYLDICLGLLNNPTATLPPDKKAAKDEYEWNTPLRELKALREVAMRKVSLSNPVVTRERPASIGSSSGRSMLVHWFPQWWGWYGSAASEPAAPSPSPAPPRLEDEILDVLADSIENNTLLKRDSVFGKFEFILNKGNLNLCMDYLDDGAAKSAAGGGGLELQFSGVSVGVESRPRAGSHALHVSLGAVVLRDHLTPDTLFPVLVAPQGMIREGLSAMSATGAAMSWCRAHAPPVAAAEPLFQLTYEKKPFGLNCDYKLWVKSASLEVVYCGCAARWAQQFLCAPWRARDAPQRAYAAVRDQTRARLIDHWEHIMHPHLGERRSWHVELDISAPQILFVEDLCDREASVLVVDFGRMRLANAHLAEEQQSYTDDDEMFMTPCSTPPGSLLSPASPPELPPQQHVLDAANLHNRLYERYTIEFSDLQILVGRARDNWKYAHMKTTSSLHLLDRFSILLQAERRVVHTSDPQYPTATLCGTLPALVVHLSEHKLAAVRNVLANCDPLHASREPGAPEPDEDVHDDVSVSSETERSEHSSGYNSSLYLLQFAIDQMSLEVQSRGRSIAEVQVCGVKAGLQARPADTSLSLSVHSLLLVDALQTYGPDFELLVASHKHVGMDTASGSIRGSEPTSPTSPTSPASPTARSPQPPPQALHQALYSLYHGTSNKHPQEAERAKSPIWGWVGQSGLGGQAGQAGACSWSAAGLVDAEALIAVELCLVRGDGDSEDLRIANILFNNLDIIANQETIVELIGFVQRVSAPRRAAPPAPPPSAPPAGRKQEEAEAERPVRTEITFDFHRLGAVLVRAAPRDSARAAKKIATATVTEARIQATIGGGRVEGSGSLGGVQLVSLGAPAPHARVLAAGGPTADRALTFSVMRALRPGATPHNHVVEVCVRVHVASVWYTHSGELVRELQSCLAEFKQYLANLARSIRAAAADMAIGLVHPRGEALYVNPRLSASAEGVSPRRRAASLGSSLDDAPDSKPDNVLLSVSVELESPVVVLPRAATSTHVLVAHLGRMSLSNRPGPPSAPHYRIRIRDISLVTLDVTEKLKRLKVEDSMQHIYDVSCGKPVLHDTALQLTIASSGSAAASSPVQHDHRQYVISGKIVGGLHVSARREQYEQVLETLRGLAAPVPPPTDTVDASAPRPQATPLVEPAVPTLQLDPQLRAAVLAVPPPRDDSVAALSHLPHTLLKVDFSLPQFTVELRADLGTGERSLVQLAFREFTLDYERIEPHYTTLLVSLHSITMEDLTKEPDSKHRMLMVSHTPQMLPKAVFVSKSCPDLVSRRGAALAGAGTMRTRACSTSLPAELHVIEGEEERDSQDSKTGVSPASSPEDAPGPMRGEGKEDEAELGEPEETFDEEESELSPDDNLVRISVHMRDPLHPDFDKYNKVSRLTKVDFNCLNLVVSIDSWVAVLDFFGVAGDEEPDHADDVTRTEVLHPDNLERGVSETEMSIRSLRVVLVGGGEVCRALVSRVRVRARAAGGAGGARCVRGRLGALALSALQPRAPLWRDRFRTHGDRALTFTYRRLSAAEAQRAGHETSLSVGMGPVTYVHTKRFVLELQAFARDFSLLRKVILQARRKVSVSRGAARARLRLRVACAAPVIVLPLSARSRAALLAQLERLTIDNCFKRLGEPGTLSAPSSTDPGCVEQVEVRTVRVAGVSLWCARGGRGGRVRRQAGPLLPAPASLTLHLQLSIADSRNVPELCVQGKLTTLQCALEPAQYRLVRGVLAHNLGEDVTDLQPHAHHHPHHPHHQHADPNQTLQVWKTMSLRLDLLDVSLRLSPARGAALACVNFIKSRLVLETYSDLSQDIDLVSQEILVSDSRFAGEPANRRGNVFGHIVQPMPDHPHSVQAEVHARKRGDSSAYTILINNMRLMAILDWWEAANQFIMQPPLPAADPDQLHLEETDGGGGPHAGGGGAAGGGAEEQLDLKLNITDSQLVLVEDASLWDTNAVILKSTTVVRYTSGVGEAGRVSCELSGLEVFSCVLGLEEETALPILDPAALTVTLRTDRVLQVSGGALSLRLSYHDMRMFAAMLRSLPAQARAALALSLHHHASGQQPDEPANRRARAPAAPAREPAPQPATAPPPPAAVWPLEAVQVRAESVSLCVIDDCLDSDVPLLDLTLTDLLVTQDLRKASLTLKEAKESTGAVQSGPGGGRLGAVLSADYYNRMLSGWEPVLEPWRFETRWENTLSSELSYGRLQVDVTSDEMLNTNITSSLIELCQLVRANWTADYYAPQSSLSEQSPKGSPAGHRRRSPFVPYALRNHTGHKLWFTTLLTTADVLTEGGAGGAPCGQPDDGWVCVRAGDTEPFSFGLRRGRGGGGPGAGVGAGPRAHVLHQLALALDGWASPDPVCVDRVGVFFRHLTHNKTSAEAWIVFEVSLEGSARKLVTVRSALQVVNRLPHPVEVRVDQAHSPVEVAGGSGGGAGAAGTASRLRGAAARRVTCPLLPASALTPTPFLSLFVACAHWSGSMLTGPGARGAVVAAGAEWAAALGAAGSVWVRPARARPPAPAPAPAPLDWRRAGAEPVLLHAECRAHPEHIYRFCCVIVRERFPRECGADIPGHTLTLVPALRLENLLPLELQYRAARAGADDAAPAAAAGALAPGDTRPFHEVNVEEGVEISVKLEGFAWSSALSVGAGGAGGAGSFSARLKLRDTRARRLYLNARVTVNNTDGIKVCISAAYWLVNRTGLPLVFRAEGAAHEAPGQWPEHEVARMVAPLLFSFADSDAGPTLAVRLGTALPGAPEWCSPFGLGPGTAVKKLEVRGGGGAGAAGDRVYVVGVCVRAGRGRYRHTNIVTFTPRYQLHNNTSFHLQFAQKCTATTLNDPGAVATHVSAVAGCYLPWHWPRWDRERLLCVRVLADSAPPAPRAPRTAWSGGFKIDAARSLHIACRESGGAGYLLLRVEAATQGATVFVVVSEAEGAPPPLRVDNRSPVGVMFHQPGGTDECVVGAHAAAPWALPEPEGARALALRAPGGPRTTLSLDALGTTHRLLYQNFIYVVFTATASTSPSASTLHAHNALQREEGKPAAGSDDGTLVLEVPLGTMRVVLGRKRYGDRSQLWRRGPNEQLIHEGSSPPQPTDAHLADDAPLSPHAMVLDIEGPAPRPGRPAALVLRRADGRRASTQAWRVVPPGRMACAHANLCVQPDGGLMALAPGSRVVLALQESGARAGALPRHQAVAWHTLRPGSGRLDVALCADGPTRLLRIYDHSAPESGWMEGSGSGSGSETGSDGVGRGRARREWGASVSVAGVSVSLVGRAPTGELVHAQLDAPRLEVGVGRRSARVALTVRDMQWDNQLPGTPSPVLLYCLPAPEATPPLPALHASLDLLHEPVARYNAYFFTHFVVALRPLAVRLEERLMLQLWAWAAPEEEEAREQPDEADYETRRMLDDLTALHATRYYFGLIKIIPSQIRLSMCTANKLEPELSTLKRRLALTLIRFEDAAVELEPFVRAHPFDTAATLARQIYQHFKDELKWQAAKILGSVDFLGNPLGFVADVSEGVTGLILEGNVGALFKNVTHGISNSAAKVTESLGDGLERVVSDEAHEETRRRIRSAATGAHLAAGFRGLGLGILGGMTSLVKHSYEGATQEGLPGFLAGVGKGLVGTVTKPMIGVLDLAAETASALRETSRRADRVGPTRRREPRCVAGPGGLLPRYCARQAEAAALLHALNGGDYSEACLAYRTVRDTPHDIRVLVSARTLRVVTGRHGAPQVVLEAALGQVQRCTAVAAAGAHLVELGVRGAEGVRRPRVQCDSSELAAWVATHVALARRLHHERAHTLHPRSDPAP